jgi:proteic killer suppression protein
MESAADPTLAGPDTCLHGIHETGMIRAPPGNRLEALHGDLKGRHSIRINDQWRVVFRWVSGDAHDVRVTDYHG